MPGGTPGGSPSPWAVLSYKWSRRTVRLRGGTLGLRLGGARAKGTSSSQVTYQSLCACLAPSTWWFDVCVYLSFELSCTTRGASFGLDGAWACASPCGGYPWCGRSWPSQHQPGHRHGCLPHPRWESHWCMTNSSPRLMRGGMRGSYTCRPPHDRRQVGVQIRLLPTYKGNHTDKQIDR